MLYLPRILRLFPIFLASLLVSCQRPGPVPDSKKNDVPVLTLHAEDLVSVEQRSMLSGPLITGSIQAERVADVRAEISATVLDVRKNNGERVRRGDVLVRFDDTAIKDALVSATVAVRTASQGLAQAERQLTRLETLQASGMVTTQQLEDAQIKRNAMRSELSANQSREALAAQQLSRTQASAPFDGVVAERKVSPGDTAMVGKELLKVIDTTSMRFEGMVAAEAATSVQVGQPVRFRVNGYPAVVFQGRVQRIYPVTSAATRQVAVLVTIDQGPQPSLMGLYAEGRVSVQSQATITIAPSAVVRQDDKAHAWCEQSGVLQKVDLTLGRLDQDRAMQEVLSGLEVGRRCVRYPNSALSSGQKVVMPQSGPTKPPV